MKAKLLQDAGEIKTGDAVDIIGKAESPETDELEYTVRDNAGHEEDVATRDFEIDR